MKHALAFALVAACPAMAENIETWHCGNIVLEADWDAEYFNGSIQLDGLPKQSTDARIDGLDRRWNWGINDDGHYQFSFVINPNKTGLYFAFGNSKTAKPKSHFWDCHKHPH